MPVRQFSKPSKYLYISEIFDRPHKAQTKMNIYSENYHGLTPGSWTSTPTVGTTVVWNESITSVNSPGYYTKKKVRVEWKPKRFTLARPFPPRLIITPLPDLKLKPGISASLKAKVIGKFNKRYLSVVAKRKGQIARFDLLSQRYTKRLANYERLLQLERDGIFSYRKVRVSKADLQVNPYSRTRTFLSGQQGMIIYVQNCTQEWSETRGTGPYVLNRIGHFYKGYATGTFGAAPANLTTSVSNRLTRKLFKQLNEQSVHVGNLMAERAQTFSMMKDIMRRIIAVKRNPLAWLSQKLTVGKSSKQLADDVLAFKFGVEPLIHDFYGSLKALARLTSDQQSDQLIVRCSANGSDSTYTQSVPDSYGTVSKYNVFQTVKISYTIKYRIINKGTSELQSFGLLNPAEILWEVAPWSFVIDWFYPIGNYINSLSASAGIEFVSGTKTVVTTTTYQTTVYNPGIRSGASKEWFCYANVGSMKTEQTKVRTVLSTAPTPRLPAFKSPISAWHIAEALALFRQRIR